MKEERKVLKDKDIGKAKESGKIGKRKEKE